MSVTLDIMIYFPLLQFTIAKNVLKERLKQFLEILNANFVLPIHIASFGTTKPIQCTENSVSNMGSLFFFDCACIPGFYYDVQDEFVNSEKCEVENTMRHTIKVHVSIVQ